VIESFDDVRDLAEDRLRALLARGRPEERVWAIWALALRSAGNVGELARHRDPDPGVRRNLAVVLAGHGELDLLVALAQRDPAAEVRAGAMQLVARLAVDGKLAPELVIERVHDDGSQVRSAVLGTVSPTAPRWLLALAIELLDDPDADVRYEAFEALVRAGTVEPAIVWLDQVPDAEAKLAVMRWSARCPIRTCAELLAGTSRRLRRLLIDSVRAASWNELAPAIGSDPQLLTVLLRRDAGELARVPLASLVRSAIADPQRAWLDTIRGRLATCDSVPDEVVPLLPDLLEVTARIPGQEATREQIARFLIH
jgi:HEAT repeat protein